jgi:hypothetical protein
MVENGQVWASGGRTVRVLDREDERVVVVDSYGRRRWLSEDELQHGFTPLMGQVERVRGVMARRALADVEPA